MEELQSTEILDREILEDARKKAHRILKTADGTIKTNAADWEQKLTETLGKLTEQYARQGKSAADEIMARLPIDKRRAKAKKIEELLNAAAAGWYAGLSREQVLELLKQGLERRLAKDNDVISTGELRVGIHRLERVEAETLLRAVVPGVSCVIEELPSASPYPVLRVETPQARIYASIGKIVDYFMDEKRAELVEALLGNDSLLGETA